MLYCINFLSALYMMIGYVSLLPKQMKYRYYITIFIYIFSIYMWATSLGQWATFLFIFGNTTIIYLGNKKQLFPVLFSLVGYFINVFLQHICTVPLSIIGFSVTYIEENHMLLFLLVQTSISYIILRIIRQFFILPRLPILQTCPHKLLRLFLAETYVSAVLLGFNFIYGESVGYPTDVLSMNGFMIAILTLSAVLIFYGMYDILVKNHELTLQQAQADIMKDYTKRMESFYDEIRVFRHDYRNILATMQDYIDTGDIHALQEYFHDKILANTDILSDDGFFLGKLHLIEDHAIKSLLYTKLISILNHNLSLTLELTERIPDIAIDNLLLCRVLGILLDNAIEASLTSDEKALHLAIVRTDNAVIFSIANSTTPLEVPVSQLSTQGYTTKENHSGLGLYTINKLLDPLSNVSLCTEYHDEIFKQTLEICTEYYG